MFALAIRLLLADQAKLYGLVFGVAFATLLITQQAGLFVGLMTRVQNVVAEAADIDIWVMDPSTEHLNLTTGLPASELARVRGIAGVASAWPLLKANLTVRDPLGRASTALLLGTDPSSFAGISKRFLLGTPQSLLEPDAVAIDRVGYMRLWPDAELALGRTIEINNRRARIAAITDAAPAFGSQVILYARFSEAHKYASTGRNPLSFILVRAAGDTNHRTLAANIEAGTGLKAATSAGLSSATVHYYVRRTGIAVNFATTIILGIIVGIAITGLTFSLFIRDNIRHYALLKAVGASQSSLVRAVLMQIALVSGIGFAIGTGLGVGFFELVSTPTSAFRGFTTPWWIPPMTLVIMAVTILLSSLLGLRRAVKVDPATVFKV